MKTISRFIVSLLMCGVWGSVSAEGNRPVVQVAFLLDTTGSMGGLIDGAKAKIWHIANEIAKGKPSPEIRMALVGYRDRGDDYVTRTTNFSNNLDVVYSDLMGFRADGGGDTQEHVWKGLLEAVEGLAWSKEPRAFKVIYLVGDAPGHGTYGDTPPLEKIIEKAVRQGIIINTIQCGADAATSQEWRKIAGLGEGTYLAIAQDGGVSVLETPFDKEIAKLSVQLAETSLGYGHRAESMGESKALAARVMAVSAPAVAADRASYRMREGYDQGDLLNAIKNEGVSIGALSEKELPPELKGLTLAEKKAKVDLLEKERERLEKALAALQNERNGFLAKNTQATQTGFDQELMKSLKTQAAKKGIRY
ncbi:MAG: VWA domain-containing protein [Elusimicrobia bacterium]|nr:VWA domain-containing protein [Elusimicrobiota bacterium]